MDWLVSEVPSQPLFLEAFEVVQLSWTAILVKITSDSGFQLAHMASCLQSKETV